MIPAVDILEKAQECFKAARISAIVGAGYLHEISSKKLYEGRYSSFGEFCEEACQISQSFAAKLIKVHEHYVLEGGLSRDQIRGVDTEKLYLSRGLPGGAAAQAVRAQVLTRSEIKAEIASKGGEECRHEDTITICTKCHKRI